MQNIVKIKNNLEEFNGMNIGKREQYMLEKKEDDWRKLTKAAAKETVQQEMQQ